LQAECLFSSGVVFVLCHRWCWSRSEAVNIGIDQEFAVLDPNAEISALTCSTDFASLVTSSSFPSDKPNFLTRNIATRS